MLRRNRGASVYGHVGLRAIEDLDNRLADEFGKQYCLDLGSGKYGAEDKRFTSVDIDPATGADIIGDIRCLFAPADHFREKIKDYPDLEQLVGVYEAFKLVRLRHIVEHIEWIYQEVLIDWVLRLLQPGGAIIIYTPNLEFILKVYSANLDLYRRGKALKFPVHEHPYLKPGVPWDVVRWANFKLNSGCSPGDFHHCIYDELWLGNLLNEMGFERIALFAGQSLAAQAFKPGLLEYGTDEAVDRVVRNG